MGRALVPVGHRGLADHVVADADLLDRDHPVRRILIPLLVIADGSPGPSSAKQAPPTGLPRPSVVSIRTEPTTSNVPQRGMQSEPPPQQPPVGQTPERFPSRGWHSAVVVHGWSAKQVGSTQAQSPPW